MLAVIHHLGTPTDAGSTPLAGRPLLVRQLQWLRTLGVDRVAVEVGTSEQSLELASRIEREQALSAGVVTVLAGAPLDPIEIARRAGFAPGDRVLAVPADVLGGADAIGPAPTEGDVTLRGVVPAALAGLEPGGIRVATLGAPAGATASAEAGGWLVRVTSVEDAVRLGAAVLAGDLPELAGGVGAALVIHAARGERDVWIGRGATVEEGATLVGPVLVGPGATVRAGAVVGPSVVLGDRAVVERGCTLREVHVDDGVVLGEGLLVERAHVTARALRPFDARDALPIDDPLLLAPRDEATARRLPSRAAALALLPIAIAIDLLITPLRRALGGGGAPAWISGRLLGVLAGRRRWVGVGGGGEPAPVVAVDDVLVPDDADATARRLARAWYLASKSPALDGRLALRVALRLLARSTPRRARALPPAARRDAGPEPARAAAA